VEVQAEPGESCRITLLSPSGQPAHSRDIIGTGALQTVVFAGPAPNPVLVTIARLEK
jgi:hypothetical protein